MAIYTNTTTPANNTSKRTTTNYEQGIFEGTQYESTEVAVQQAALKRMGQELNHVKEIMAELGTEKTEQQLRQAIYNVHKATILNSIEARRIAAEADMGIAL